jgi:hypothetical protein
VHIINLSLVIGLLTSGLPSAVNESPTIKAVNDTRIAITPVTPAPVVEEKPANAKIHESITTQPGEADLAPQWNEFVKGCDNLEAQIKKALSKNQMKESIATEFRSDLTKIRAHIQAVKPKTKDIGFSQKLVISRDLGDLKAEVDYAIASIMHPHESVESVRSKFSAELDEAIKAKKIAQGDVDKLNAEVKQQEDLLKSMHRSTEAFASKDQELIANNFAGLHIALQRRIRFSLESIPLIDEQRKKVEEMLQNASTANTLDAEKCKQYTDSLAKIATRVNEATAKGPLSSSQIVGLAMELEGLDDIVQSQINSSAGQSSSQTSNQDSK